MEVSIWLTVHHKRQFKVRTRKSWFNISNILGVDNNEKLTQIRKLNTDMWHDITGDAEIVAKRATSRKRNCNSLWMKKQMLYSEEIIWMWICNVRLQNQHDIYWQHHKQTYNTRKKYMIIVRLYKQAGYNLSTSSKGLNIFDVLSNN